MNWHEIVLATIAGRATGCLPFIPRMDLWYKSNKHNKTLPQAYRDCTLKEITRDLGIGYHAVVPDFRDFIKTGSQALLALGIYDLNTNPYQVDLESLDITYTIKEGITKTTIHTPYGKLHSQYLYDERMQQAGASIGHTVEHLVKGVKDFKAAGYVFKNLGLGENYANYRKFQKFVGSDGVAVGFSMLAASPMHHIMKELMSFESFVFAFNDHLKEVEQLAQDIEVFYEKILETVLNSPAEIIFLGANYDSFLTWAPFFRTYITPYLKKWSNLAHKNKKFMLTHTDGENKGLLEEYADSRIDVADSICPKPMTSLTLRQVREVFKNKITIWGAIPSVCLLEKAMSEYNFEKYIHKMLEDLGDCRNIILSFADTTPPEAKFERIVKVAAITKAFKPTTRTGANEK